MHCSYHVGGTWAPDCFSNRPLGKQEVCLLQGPTPQSGIIPAFTRKEKQKENHMPYHRGLLQTLLSHYLDFPFSNSRDFVHDCLSSCKELGATLSSQPSTTQLPSPVQDTLVRNSPEQIEPSGRHLVLKARSDMPAAVTGGTGTHWVGEDRDVNREQEFTSSQSL